MDMNTKPAEPFGEKGVVGTPGYGGYITAAYLKQLRWPGGWPEFNRLWRTDPEVTIVRQLFTALSGRMGLTVELPEGAEGNETDMRAKEFYLSVVGEGLFEQWLQSAMQTVPFMGWGWWEAPLGVRSEKFVAENGWHSNYNDGLLAIRGLEFRDYSTFHRWEVDSSGRVMGLWQSAPVYNVPLVLMPLANSAHISYGDHNNPEGLSPLEAIYRLERITYGLSVVQGIGYEHTAGHAVFTVANQIDSQSKAVLRDAARALLTAQEGNYVTEIADKFTARIVDTPFAAAQHLEETINHLRLLKLAIFGMQFVGISTMSGSGSYAALDDSSSLAMIIFNSMAEGFVEQLDRQVGARLFDLPRNKAAFAGMSVRPVLKLKNVTKRLSLPELGQFAAIMNAISPLGEDDLMAIRAQSGFLPTVPQRPAATAPAGGDLATGDTMTNLTAPISRPTPAAVELAQFSQTETVEKLPEFQQLISGWTDGLTAQYGQIDIAKILREVREAGIDPTSPEATAKLEEIVARYLPPLQDSLDSKSLMASLLKMASVGSDYAYTQMPLPLPMAAGLAVTESITKWVTARLLSLVGEGTVAGATGRIDSPYLGLSLDLVSRADIARLVRQVLLEDLNVPGQVEKYRQEAERAAQERAARIADNEAGTAFGAGQYLTLKESGAKTKTWLRTQSRHPRQIHLDQVGMTIAFDERFPDGSFWANELPHCKCGISVGY